MSHLRDYGAYDAPGSVSYATPPRFSVHRLSPAEVKIWDARDAARREAERVARLGDAATKFQTTYADGFIA